MQAACSCTAHAWRASRALRRAGAGKRDIAEAWRGSRGAGNDCGTVSGTGTAVVRARQGRIGRAAARMLSECCAAQARRVRGALRTNGAVKDLDAGCRTCKKAQFSAAAADPTPTVSSLFSAQSTRACTQGGRAAIGWVVVCAEWAVILCIWAHSCKQEPGARSAHVTTSSGLQEAARVRKRLGA